MAGGRLLLNRTPPRAREAWALRTSNDPWDSRERRSSPLAGRAAAVRGGARLRPWEHHVRRFPPVHRMECAGVRHRLCVPAAAYVRVCVFCHVSTPRVMTRVPMQSCGSEAACCSLCSLCSRKRWKVSNDVVRRSECMRLAIRYHSALLHVVRASGCSCRWYNKSRLACCQQQLALEARGAVQGCHAWSKRQDVKYGEGII